MGCGGGNGAHPEVIAALGDSITAGNPGYDPDPAVRRAPGFGNNPQSEWEYWAHREHPDLRFRNCGVMGQTTQEIAQRFDQCTQGADGVVIQGGINDLRQGIPGAVALANLQGMIRAAKELDLNVAVADLLPYGPAPQSDPVIDRLNREIAGMAQREDVPVLAFHRVLEDPQRPGRMRPEWTADGIHPSLSGYRRLGELAFEPTWDSDGQP